MAMASLSSKLRCLRPTPGRLVGVLLIVEGLLWLSERFQWWPKGYAVLIAIAAIGLAILAMLLWFVVALVFRWRFQFSIRSLLVVTVAVALPFSWLAVEMKKAREQEHLVDEIQKVRGSVIHDWELGKPPTAQPPDQAGCGLCWETISL